VLPIRVAIIATQRQAIFQCPGHPLNRRTKLYSKLIQFSFDDPRDEVYFICVECMARQVYACVTSL